MIFRCYRLNFLTSEDLRAYVYKRNFKMLVHYTFPFAAFAGAFYYIKLKPHSIRFLNKRVHFWISMAFTVSSWWAFTKINPATFYLHKEKQKILEYLDSNMGHHLLVYNNLLPRYFSENYVDGMITRMYFSRNNFFSGILFNKELNGFDATDKTEY